MTLLIAMKFALIRRQTGLSCVRLTAIYTSELETPAKMVNSYARHSTHTQDSYDGLSQSPNC